MIVSLKKRNDSSVNPSIAITGSKSESNRLLLLQALYSNIRIENLSESDDTTVLKKGLEITNGIVDVHHAGTAMRFLTAYFASRQGAEIILSGSDRMHQRPIKILVDALNSLGARIEYINEDGYPPLRIFGKKLEGEIVTIEANVSSQYISALMLIAPTLPKGLKIELNGAITSIPYIEMTRSLLRKIGVDCSFMGNTIEIAHKNEIEDAEIVVESDWSSASYFYSLVALSDANSVALSSYLENSLQGDAYLASIYKTLGIETVFQASDLAKNVRYNSIILSKNNLPLPEKLSLDLSNTPDIAQTITVTCFGMGIRCQLKGLHTLKIKETDRLAALKTELEKLGASISITEDSLDLLPFKGKDFTRKEKNVIIETYQDHRMAMAFAPLSLKIPIDINDPMVVSKSFPSYWEEVEKMGITIEFQ